jgi:hypothetical protein
MQQMDARPELDTWLAVGLPQSTPVQRVHHAAPTKFSNELPAVLSGILQREAQ